MPRLFSLDPPTTPQALNLQGIHPPSNTAAAKRCSFLPGEVLTTRCLASQLSFLPRHDSPCSLPPAPRGNATVKAQPGWQQCWCRCSVPWMSMGTAAQHGLGIPGDSPGTRRGWRRTAGSAQCHGIQRTWTGKGLAQICWRNPGPNAVLGGTAPAGSELLCA